MQPCLYILLYSVFQLQFLIFLVLISYSILFDLPFHRLGVAEALAVAFYAVTSVSTAMDVSLLLMLCKTKTEALGCSPGRPKLAFHALTVS